jgi:Ni/Co efflux regulator RcnB
MFMSRSISWMNRIAALIVAGAVALYPLVAVSPAWAGEGGKKQDEDQREGKGKGKGQDKKAERGPDKGDRRESSRDQRDRDDARRSEPVRAVAPGPRVRVFEDRHRVVIHEYYVSEHRAGHCPPGLAKKNNGCMPPGQAKKWRVGHPLPHDVIFYDLPPPLVVQIGAPPPGYRYVRVAADILLIAVGTGLVIEAITDLGRL